ncbi:hypothetical protein [Phreatobacter oligotrophus]|jgi:hypothetical protein|uniref:hypothetical protein n=1 Tax=Phreatobacter oligotrophus TaxID=1122261 RepID=UPI0023537247|nr:hypothetical protein [Phreatobacter oligotrophus]MBX9989897.1 hypothetical protein [Phreatobacter oligotrophus]
MTAWFIRGLTIAAAVGLSACAQTAPPAPPGPPVVNATPPPLPPDPALGAHATQNQGDSQQGRRQRNR